MRTLLGCWLATYSILLLLLWRFVANVLVRDLGLNVMLMHSRWQKEWSIVLLATSCILIPFFFTLLVKLGRYETLWCDHWHPLLLTTVLNLPAIGSPATTLAILYFCPHLWSFCNSSIVSCRWRSSLITILPQIFLFQLFLNHLLHSREYNAFEISFNSLINSRLGNTLWCTFACGTLRWLLW